MLRLASMKAWRITGMTQTTISSPVQDDKLTLRAQAYRRFLTTQPLFRAVLAARMPLLALAGAKVEYVDLAGARVRLPFGWKTRNIFGTMYFGAIAMGAEAACGSLVLLHNQQRDSKFAPIVKGLQIDFRKAATSDIVFECHEGDVVTDLFDRAVASGQREEANVEVIGRTRKDGEVARVLVTWSLRYKG
jgi:acyl-coenzyme A thioesterase PaaI-like protein